MIPYAQLDKTAMEAELKTVLEQYAAVKAASPEKHSLIFPTIC